MREQLKIDRVSCRDLFNPLGGAISHIAVSGQLTILREPEITASAADSAGQAKGSVGCRRLSAVDLHELDRYEYCSRIDFEVRGDPHPADVLEAFDRLRGVADLYTTPLARSTAHAQPS